MTPHETTAQRAGLPELRRTRIPEAVKRPCRIRFSISSGSGPVRRTKSASDRNRPRRRSSSYRASNPSVSDLTPVSGTRMHGPVSPRSTDWLIAVVSVIRPGAANSSREPDFCRRAQGLEPVHYAHPSLEPVPGGTFGLITYEEHVLQICETFAGLGGGQGACCAAPWRSPAG